MQSHLTDRNLALDLVRVTEAAALTSHRFYGLGDNEAVDAAAVEAMRTAFQGLHIKGTVVVGEGEKDHAPMLYIGEQVGFGDGPELDVAVDPVDGTSVVSRGKHNALAAAGLALKGHMFCPGPSYYCQKIVVSKDAANVIDLDAPVKDNLRNVAKALGKNVGELRVFVLDKPRHEQLITDIRTCGARALMHSEGDIAGSLMVIDPFYDMDLVMGIGGTPEAVVSACAIKGSGAQILTRLAPQSEEEKKRIIDAGIDLDQIRTVDDLVSTDECYFAATGVTDGEILDGVTYSKDLAITSSITTRGRTGTRRFIKTWHNLGKLAKMSNIQYR
ncbi:MAG: class II fructose-bisphosphatase [Succinivibrio sp.]|nr:class II fructose-bisphosphatase [Succinivibrio sp.]